MIPDDTAIGAYKTILDVGVVGAVFLLHLVFTGIIVRYFQGVVAKLDAKLTKEEEAHDLTRATLLEEVKSGREMLSTVRGQMSSQASALDAVLKLVRKDPA